MTRIEQEAITKKWYCPYCTKQVHGGDAPDYTAACCGEAGHAVPGCPICGEFNDENDGCEHPECPHGRDS